MSLQAPAGEGTCARQAAPFELAADEGQVYSPFAEIASLRHRPGAGGSVGSRVKSLPPGTWTRSWPGTSPDANAE